MVEKGKHPLRGHVVLWDSADYETDNGPKMYEEEKMWADFATVVKASKKLRFGRSIAVSYRHRGGWWDTWRVLTPISAFVQHLKKEMLGEQHYFGYVRAEVGIDLDGNFYTRFQYKNTSSVCSELNDEGDSLKVFRFCDSEYDTPRPKTRKLLQVFRIKYAEVCG